MNDDLDFTYGDGATAYYGCGATLKGEFWYFGGSGKANYRPVCLPIINKHFNSIISGQQDRGLSIGSSK